MLINKRSDNSIIKKNNQTLILQTLMKSDILSRAEIAKMLGMSKPVVNEHIDYLLSRGILIEIGQGTSKATGGRKPILLSLNPEFCYIIAIDLSFTKPVIALGNMKGTLMDWFLIEESFGIKDLVPLFKNHIDELLKRNGMDNRKIGAAVISVPGFTHRQTGEIIFNPQHKDIYEMNLKEYLQSTYGFTVIIKNDVNMAAIGEIQFLEAEHKHSLLFLSCGRGLGAACILDGVLYEGENNSAGEIGFQILNEHGERAEEILSIKGLLKDIQQRAESGSEEARLAWKEPCFNDILAAYKKKDPLAIESIKKVGRLLGILIHNSISLLDLKTVVIGGDFIAFQDVLIPQIQEVIEQSSLPFKPEILPTRLAYGGGMNGCLTVGKNYIIENM